MRTKRQELGGGTRYRAAGFTRQEPSAEPSITEWHGDGYVTYVPTRYERKRRVLLAYVEARWEATKDREAAA